MHYWHMKTTWNKNVLKSELEDRYTQIQEFRRQLAFYIIDFLYTEYPRLEHSDCNFNNNDCYVYSHKIETC